MKGDFSDTLVGGGESRKEDFSCCSLRMPVVPARVWKGFSSAAMDMLLSIVISRSFLNWRDPLQKFRHVTHSSFGFIYFRGDVLLIVDTVL